MLIVKPRRMIRKAVTPLPPRTVLASTAILSALPILIVVMFPAQLNRVMAPASYVIFHNIAEFFSIMVSLSIFGVGWFAYGQSRDKRALFLSAAFLAIGLMDFMHIMSNPAMPAFITPNSPNKSTQFWIAVRLFQAFAFLLSASVYPKSQSRLLSNTVLMTTALVVPGVVFSGIIFFPAYVPDTFITGVGLTPFKKFSEYLVIVLLCAAALAYRRRMARTGDRVIIYYMAAFIVGIFSEITFAVYTRVFDTYNMLGHIYKIAAFFLIYKGIFIASVKEPYVRLADVTVSRDELSKEVEERRRAEANVLKLSEDMVARNWELESVNKQLESFIYSVSHDLRAPLRSMAGFAKILVEDYAGMLDKQGMDYLARINRGSEKMTRLIDDLLHLSRISRQEMERTEIDLNKMASSMVAELREANPGRSVEVSIMEGLKASADHNLIEIVLLNLLGNAWKFTSKTENARIEFGAFELSEIVYYVRDNGAGFDPDYKDKMFGPFQRLHSTDEFEGTGIGLTIVERIIHRHGGKVWAEGEPGKGATVYFTLGKSNAE